MDLQLDTSEVVLLRQLILMQLSKLPENATDVPLLEKILIKIMELK